MSERAVVERPALKVWETEVLRLTGFPSPSAEITEPAWWSEIVGEAPERKTLRPRRGGQEEEGPLEGGKLILRVTPTRIDWLFGPIYPPDEEPATFPTIGPFPKTLDTLSKLMFRWFGIQTCPPLRRLAFGAILVQPVDDRKSGYKQISAYLPNVKLDPDGSSDLIYQINRPRDSRSGVPGLRINRLSKWSVSLLQTVAFSLEKTSVSMAPGRELSACRLELDVNTSADFQGEFPREQVAVIFDELVRLGSEIVDEGDIP